MNSRAFWVTFKSPFPKTIDISSFIPSNWFGLALMVKDYFFSFLTEWWVAYELVTLLSIKRCSSLRRKKTALKKLNCPTPRVSNFEISVKFSLKSCATFLLWSLGNRATKNDWASDGSSSILLVWGASAWNSSSLICEDVSIAMAANWTLFKNNKL